MTFSGAWLSTYRTQQKSRPSLITNDVYCGCAGFPIRIFERMGSIPHVFVYGHLCLGSLRSLPVAELICMAWCRCRWIVLVARSELSPVRALPRQVDAWGAGHQQKHSGNFHRFSFLETEGFIFFEATHICEQMLDFVTMRAQDKSLLWGAVLHGKLTWSLAIRVEALVDGLEKRFHTKSCGCQSAACGSNWHCHPTEPSCDGPEPFKLRNCEPIQEVVRNGNQRHAWQRSLVPRRFDWLPWKNKGTGNQAKYSKYMFLEHHHAGKLQFLDKLLAV